MPNKVIVAVVSCQANSEYRNLCRDLWARELEDRYSIRTLYVTGDPNQDKRVMISGDNRVSLRTPDDYPNLPRKVSMLLDWLGRTDLGFDYVFKCDDDTYIFPERFSRFCQGLDQAYCGYQIDDRRFASGCGVFLSASMMQIVSDNLDYFQARGAEDVRLGDVLTLNKIKLQHVDEIVPSRNLWGGAYEGPGADYLGEADFFADKIAVHLHRFSPASIKAFHAKMSQSEQTEPRRPATFPRYPQ